MSRQILIDLGAGCIVALLLFILLKMLRMA